MVGKQLLLVGDNPFHGVSHLSQERARLRDNVLTNRGHAADLVSIALESGADGFLFTVSPTTLDICRLLAEKGRSDPVQLYAIVPYAYELVRSAVRVGGLPRLAGNIAKQIILSRNLKAVTNGLFGIVKADPVSLLRAYLLYEVSRIRLSACTGNTDVKLVTVLLHEAVTDMGLAFDMKWLFQAHIDLMLSLGIKPGFETRNFPFLMEKLGKWNINAGRLVVAAPFNPIGFQMCPSQEECERTLRSVTNAEVIAFSILAAGRVRPRDAAEYVATLHNLKGVVVGVSKEDHARETFQILSDKLSVAHREIPKTYAPT